MLSLEGKQLGNYDVIRRIRVGGMGAVYEGRQRTAFDRRVAIKVILGDYAADPEMRRSFAQEARTVARLHHPHILPLIEFGDEQGILYLVMPFIENGTLTSYLRRSLPDLAEVAAIYQQLLDAVEYAHDAGLIHRDIKSSNVLLEIHRSGAPYVYLADFGLVRTARSVEAEQTGKVLPLDQVPGTPHYMAPEQTRGIVTKASDIYALGVLLYQMLTGELPYNDSDDVKVIQMHLYDPIPSPCDHDSSIPSELAEVVCTAMAKQPEQRFRNVAELRTAFLAAIKGPGATTQADEAAIEQNHMHSPKRHVSMPLLLPEVDQHPVSMPLPAQKAAVPRHLRQVAPIILPEPQERPRVTDTIRNKPSARSFVKQRQKRFAKIMLATMLVPVLLLCLLLVPRALGLSLFPVGFPLLGASPIATVDVVAKSKMVQDRYLLTASPQIKQPDLVAHTIPDRQLQSSATDSRTVQTTGTKSIAGTRATGTVLFINNTNTPVSVPASFKLATPSGIHIQTTASAIIPPNNDGQDGQALVAAIAVDPGVAGNIAAHALDGTTSNGLSVQNPAAFSGGVDAQTVHVVNQVDLDGVQSSLAPRLQQQVMQHLSSQVKANEVMTGEPIYTTTVSASSLVGAQVDHVQVTVMVSGTATVYDHNVLDRIATQLLSKEAMQTLDSNYQLQGSLSISSSRVIAAEKNGLVYLNVSLHGLWVYTLTPQQANQWRQSIKGASSAAAQAYLHDQPGVATVRIHLPFGADHLPSSVDDIQIVLV
ncbi:MAG: protein kinase [Chloroflexi bacterium]|nr:protein kinase [Chloroflexota bacterium]